MRRTPREIVRYTEQHASHHLNCRAEASSGIRILLKLPQIRFDLSMSGFANCRFHAPCVEARPRPDKGDREAQRRRLHAGASRRRRRFDVLSEEASLAWAMAASPSLVSM